MGSAEVVPPPPAELIRVYHLTPAEFAINNIALGRLKVTRFSDLNDPFELISLNFKERRRRLGFRIYGDPEGLPVLFLHGTPGSRLKFAIAHEAGKSLALAIVAPDRWGYGLTEAPSKPSLRGFADDMAALMDKLRSRRFAVGGISGGGPYAAAVAACLEPRVAALALVSPVGPIADAGLGPSLPLLHRLCFTVLPNRPRTVSTASGRFAGVWRIRRGWPAH